MAEIPRVLLARVPDWTIRAVRLSTGQTDPLLVVDKGKVVARCELAAAEGVEVGLRVRAAQLRCPDAVVVPHDPRVEEECFAPVVAAIEQQVVPAVHVVRPGVAAVRAGGVSRFYGGEPAAAQRLRQVLCARGLAEAGVGIADGLFAAGQAALRAEPVMIVPAGGSGEFLSGLEIGALDAGTAPKDRGSSDLVRSLRGLGLRTLGRFAALDHQKVVTRFGPDGGRAHLLAAGIDTTPLTSRRPDADDAVEITFPDPLGLAEQVAAGVEPLASAMLQDLGRRGMSCDEVRIVIRSTDGLSEQVWRHPWQFSSTDLVSRVVWQLSGTRRRDADEEACAIPAGVEAVRLVPTARPAAEHAEGLFGARPAEHLMAILTRLQDRLGPQAVLTPAVTGGRLLKERRQLTPFGSLPEGRSRLEEPWPGRLSGPAPGVVFQQLRPVRVQTADGSPARPCEPGTGDSPEWFTDPSGRRRRVIAWAGPWPVLQRWWDAGATSVERFQLVTEDQQAWVLAASGDSWWAEARYD
ncbi:DNA polymerase Y family protein [Acidipropionibacterium acidipropionici]|uniref:DNA polymerase Y family protein n=1 Tax=Acidipropionibacterium acidipropionici TaxID=1748 RepID=UPI0005A0E865|nr:DNA polymerase Y family protein [Acidipropionibacterium acidipropionici]